MYAGARGGAGRQAMMPLHGNQPASAAGPSLIGGFLTKRMHLRLLSTAEMAADMSSDNMPEFQKYVPLSSSEASGVSFWNHIPPHVRGAEVHKSFAHGFLQVIKAIAAVF